VRSTQLSFQIDVAVARESSVLAEVQISDALISISASDPKRKLAGSFSVQCFSSRDI